MCLSMTKLFDYIICGTPRTGSQLLRHYLMNVEAGCPIEWLPHKGNIDIPEVSDIYCVTVFWGSFEEFLTLYDGSFVNKTKYIFLTRRDKIRQGISLLKASQTGCWNSNQSVTAPAVYDNAALDKVILRLCKHETEWFRYFQNKHINPHIVAYEDLDKKPYRVLCNILSFLDLPVRLRNEVDNLEIPLRRLSDAESEDWLSLYLRGSHA